MPQLRTVLYERLGLTPGRKTKTGFSTDARTLEQLRGQHPIIEALLRYREVEKLRSTYGESLAAEVAADGRIHATFRQTVARTGRLSSDRPNLHNIPVRTEEGRRFREAFVPVAGPPPAGGRLRPGRAAGHRPPVRATPGSRRPSPPARTSTARWPPGCSASTGTTVTLAPAVHGQDGLLRPGLRHGGLRAVPAAGRAGGGGPGDPGRLLRRLPVGPRLHGPGRGRGPDHRVHGDRLRPTPAAARSDCRPTTRSARRPSARP